MKLPGNIDVVGNGTCHGGFRGVHNLRKATLDPKLWYRAGLLTAKNLGEKAVRGPTRSSEKQEGYKSGMKRLNLSIQSTSRQIRR